jgi:CRISPR-associated protein Cas2
MKAYIIMYDISDNRIRNLVIKTLKRNGLYRVQKSVFMGATHPSKIEEMEQMFREWIDKENEESDRYIILPLNKDMISKIKWINFSLDISFYLGEKPVHFI